MYVVVIGLGGDWLVRQDPKCGWEVVDPDGDCEGWWDSLDEAVAVVAERRKGVGEDEAR